MPGNPINVIRVPTNNSRFRSLSIRPGDILKYYVLADETVDPDSARSGLSRQVAMDLKIAQVIDDTTLIIEGGLNQQVEFPSKIEVWRYLDIRLSQINEQLVQYDERRLPALGWEPAGDGQVLTQILTWLNQWLRQNSPPADWKPDPMLANVGDKLGGDTEFSAKLKPAALLAKTFEPHEARILQEVTWLRDIGRWAHGDKFDDVGRAAALFDWTIRNVQLEDDEDATARRPWQTLLYSRGTAAQRAWVFAELCRQQGLMAVVVGVPIAPPAGEAGPDGSERYWLPAVVSNNQLYLFDPRLGLPIPGPDGKGVATLEQVRSDDALVRQLDVEGMPYPLSADALKKATVFLVADLFSLTRRAFQLEGMFSGKDHVALAVKPTDVAKQLEGIAGVEDVSLWEFPLRTLRDQLTMGKSNRHREALAFEPYAVRPALWKARTRHFQGRRKAASEPGGDVLDDHQEAARLYLSKSVRPTDEKIAAITSADQRRVETNAKQCATYLLGLLSYDDGKYDVAADWFRRPELNETEAATADGARYNLARSLEAQGKLEEAIPLLENDTSPQVAGNKIRARNLKSQAAEKKAPNPAEAKK
jgi:hypothetical protein